MEKQIFISVETRPDQQQFKYSRGYNEEPVYSGGNKEVDHTPNLEVHHPSHISRCLFIFRF